MGSSKKGGQKVQVTDYLMSMHMGFCTGPVDALLSITIQEKEAWSGSQSALGDISINKPELFGGNKKEGGAVGVATYLPGDVSQLMPEGLAARLGRTTATCPGFRGVATLFFTGGGSGGFNWSSNTPYQQGVWAKLRRVPVGANPTGAVDANGNVNPSHIIYECLTNSDWGMGSAASKIDIDSYLRAASVLASENFYLSMKWTRQSDIETFVNDVLNHISATQFVDPRTGKHTLRLFRDDYNVDDLREITVDTAVLSNFQRKGWGETINEIVVTWTNPESEETETTTVQDLGNIDIQGEVISDSRNYYGIRTADLAAFAGQRDIRASSYPLSTLEGKLNRSWWDITPGEVVKITWPARGLDKVVYRVGKVDYGSPGDATIKVDFVEEIFSLDAGAYIVPPSTQWIDPSQDPQPMDYTQVLSAPAYFAAYLTGGDPDDVTYPQTLAGVLAASHISDTISFELNGEETLPNGDAEFGNVGTKEIPGHGKLAVALVAEATSIVLAFNERIGNQDPIAAGFVFIGDGDDTDTEIAMIQSIGVGGMTLKRGVLDTIPRAWPVGTNVFFMDRDLNWLDLSTVRSEGEGVEYKLQPRTSKGLLPIDDAEMVSYTLTARPCLPSRPANVKVLDVAFPTEEIDATEVLTTIPITWATRNRVSETTVVLGWTDASVPPEEGQTTSVIVMDELGNVVGSHVNLAGTSFDLPVSSFGDLKVGFVKVCSVRDDLESIQSMVFPVRVVAVD